jgi:HJR/Mrr/RecB family endonuclease
MKVARYLFPTTHGRKRRLYRKSKTDLFSAYGAIKLIFKMMLYLISAIIGITIFSGTLIYKGIKRIKDYRHYKEIGMNSLMLRKAIKRMNPRQFEIFTAELFKANGYEAEATVESCDGGKDVVAFKNGDKIFIECKKWNQEPCGRVVLQKLIGSCIGAKANKAIFITTSWYNSNAIEYAKTVPWLELWDTNDLLNMLYNTNIKKVPWIMSKAIEYHEEDILDKIDNFGSKIDKYSSDLDRQY